ncbi:MAG: phosphoribosylformylglycinamidine synthase subunit PurQ [Candidatus Bathyarchaeia archaeon]|nr:phosphoribosylformylglycinamidine synthase subunit PurQ [Candidatus Bathyarchaeota archaeon]
MNKNVKVAVVRVAGTNCEIETAYAFKLAGAKPEIIHMNEFYKKRKNLEEYQVLAFPGGFSYGDDIAAAKLWANEIKYKLKKEVQQFVEEGKPVIGICNGFQVLVKTGLLPAFEEPMKKQEATLAFNNIGLYHDRWVYLKPESKKCIFTKNLNKIIFLPVAHAEGKFVINEEGLKKLEENNQIVFRYVNDKGELAGFPWNPNGSIGNIAGICNPEGNILGLMPHPERFIHKWMHPLWTKLNSLPKEGDGLIIFKNAVEYAAKKF